MGRERGLECATVIGVAVCLILTIVNALLRIASTVVNARRSETRIEALILLIQALVAAEFLLLENEVATFLCVSTGRQASNRKNRNNENPHG